LKRIIIFCAFFLALNAAAYCAQVSRIELTDGSVINGEITSFAGGVYTINTAFGEIKIESGSVSRIESANPPALITSISSAVQENNLTLPQIDSYKQQLMNNPENTAIITGLAAAPEIQELVKDPQIVEAAKAGDIQALMKNEKFMNIVNSPQVQEAFKKLKQ
jgi:hypothetical protein